jgi:acyl-coenzyme A synthetase/AMP-(fatty) acid ligase
VEPRKFCPVGKLLPGVQIVVMDDNMAVQPIGVKGEVHIMEPSPYVFDSLTVKCNKQHVTGVHGLL